MSDPDPLPSWVDGPNKSAILDFVARVTNADDPDFRPVAERIATFDNDGTLWCEFPLLVQLLFTLAEVKRLPSQRPDLLDKPAYRAFLADDVKTVASLPKQEVVDAAFAVHAGMTVDDFATAVGEWFSSARHPSLGRLILDCAYQPQRELLAHLRANGFKTFIVTGGGIGASRFATLVWHPSRAGGRIEQQVPARHHRWTAGAQKAGCDGKLRRSR